MEICKTRESQHIVGDAISLVITQKTNKKEQPKTGGRAKTTNAKKEVVKTPSVDNTATADSGVWNPTRKSTKADAAGIRDRLLSVQIAQPKLVDIKLHDLFYIDTPDPSIDIKDVDRLDLRTKSGRIHSAYLSTIASITLIEPQDLNLLKSVKTYDDLRLHPKLFRFQEYLKANPEKGLHELILEVVLRVPLFNINADPSLTDFFRKCVHVNGAYTGFPEYRTALNQIYATEFDNDAARRNALNEASNALRATSLKPEIQSMDTAILLPVCKIA